MDNRKFTPLSIFLLAILVLLTFCAPKKKWVVIDRVCIPYNDTFLYHIDVQEISNKPTDTTEMPVTKEEFDLLHYRDTIITNR